MCSKHVLMYYTKGLYFSNFTMTLWFYHRSSTYILTLQTGTICRLNCESWQSRNGPQSAACCSTHVSHCNNVLKSRFSCNSIWMFVLVNATISNYCAYFAFHIPLAPIYERIPTLRELGENFVLEDLDRTAGHFVSIIKYNGQFQHTLVITN